MRETVAAETLIRDGIGNAVKSLIVVTAKSTAISGMSQLPFGACQTAAAAAARSPINSRPITRLVGRSLRIPLTPALAEAPLLSRQKRMNPPPAGRESNVWHLLFAAYVDGRPSGFVRAAPQQAGARPALKKHERRPLGAPRTSIKSSWLMPESHGFHQILPGNCCGLREVVAEPVQN